MPRFDLKPVSRRALVGVLSVGAVLVPAVAIAYLGAVSYREDRGLVAAKVEEQFRTAWDVAQRLERELSTALDAAHAAYSAGGAAALTSALAERGLDAPAFVVDDTGDLATPAANPLQRPGPRATPRRPRAPKPCLGGLASCMQRLRASELRTQQLELARQLEATARGAAESRRLYRSLAAFDDTGAEALLGLGRLDLSAGSRAAASAIYRRLAADYADAVNADGVPYLLLAELGTAEATPTAAAALDLLARVVGREFDAPGPALWAVASRLSALAGERAGARGGDREQLVALERQLDAARREARFAATLAGEADDLFRTAGDEARGRPSLLVPSRTLVFRRAADGGVVGLVVERRVLDDAAVRAAGQAIGLPPQARARIRRLGEQQDTATERQLATASFGPLLPHLNLSLVVDRRLPDPLDEIVERRGRRHVLLTGGLMILLMIGLVATIRGAARERELARLKSEFVSTVSHELKTPLTSIRMFAEMLQQGVAGSDREREARYHEIIVKESERLGLLIANLLDYSQIERGTRRYSRHSEALADLAREAVETFRRLREGENQAVSLDVEPAAEAIRIFADREVIVQSILNLLSNAAKYSGGQPIAIAVRDRGERGGAISVTDQGPGIPSAEHERIFREFYRAPSAYKSQIEGTGLGLALVKRHVEAHGGAVELDSTEGAGATFSVLLPRIHT